MIIMILLLLLSDHICPGKWMKYDLSYVGMGRSQTRLCDSPQNNPSSLCKLNSIITILSKDVTFANKTLEVCA